MNNKAHLRPKDYDSNGDIIPMACKEEKSDSISREALKEVINDLFRSGEYDCSSVLKAIDNAPAVDLTKNQVYDKGFITAMKAYSKPKGEWILVDDKRFIVKCSVCGRTEDSRMIKYYPYCHCGARMKGSDHE